MPESDRPRKAMVCPNSLGKALEKGIVLPLRARRTVGDPFEQAHDNPVELCRRCLIHRLTQIVGRFVIAVAHKIMEDLVFRCAELVAELERQRRHALANKAVPVSYTHLTLPTKR